MQLQNSHGDVKQSIGKGVAKELMCMDHGHEQWCGDCLRVWEVLNGGGEMEKDWDNCNSIINKIEFKKVLGSWYLLFGN